MKTWIHYLAPVAAIILALPAARGADEEKPQPKDKEGDEVTLTYLRAGKQATAKVKLAMHEVPKMSALDGGGARAFSYATGSGNGQFEMRVGRPDGLEGEEWNRVLGLLQHSRGAP